VAIEKELMASPFDAGAMDTQKEYISFEGGSASLQCLSRRKADFAVILSLPQADSNSQG